MPDFFSKSLDEITVDDIRRLRGTPEGQTFELKGSLPAENAQARPDSWMTIPKEGKSRKGPEDYAKEGIFREIVAFANAEGGWLVLGVEETNDKPKRAAAVTPLPACHELANRLKRAAADWLDPPVPGLQFRGIEIEEGKGVIVARVPRSPIAPHRLYKARRSQEAYRRIDDETKPMRMREIQDMTLERSRSESYVEAAFARARSFYPGVRYEPYDVHLGYQIVAVPTAGPLALFLCSLQ